jgi:hypothetical protein
MYRSHVGRRRQVHLVDKAALRITGNAAEDAAETEADRRRDQRQGDRVADRIAHLVGDRAAGRDRATEIAASGAQQPFALLYRQGLVEAVGALQLRDNIGRRIRPDDRVAATRLPPQTLHRSLFS